MTALKLGVIGAGAWAVYSHLPVLAARGDEVDFAAVSRLGAAELESVRRRFGFRVASEDYKGVPAQHLDVCVISSPAGLHHLHAKAALQAGTHVLVEKPFTLSVADAWDLVETADRLQRHLVVAFGYNYLPAVIAFTDALKQAGGIRSIEQCFLSMASCTRELLSAGGSYPEVGHGDIPAPDPRTGTDPVMSGGGYAQAQLTHVLALALPLLDDIPTEVVAVTNTLPGASIDAHDAAILRFANGAVGSLSGASSWVGVDSSRDVVTLRAISAEGQWLLDLDADRAWIFRHGWATEQRLPMPRGSGDYNCVGRPNALIDLALGRPVRNRSPGRLAAQTVAVLDAFYRSCTATDAVAAGVNAALPVKHRSHRQETSLIIGPAHVSFTVSDIERSKHFYADLLGLPLAYEMVHNHPYTAKQVGYEDARLLAAGFHLGPDISRGPGISQGTACRHGHSQPRHCPPRLLRGRHLEGIRTVTHGRRHVSLRSRLVEESRNRGARHRVSH